MKQAQSQKKLALLVAGGPAPGINGVIRSVTIEAINSGLSVLGIYDGFKWLMEGDSAHIRPLKIEDVSRIHLSGGSILRTSRSDPTKSSKSMATVLKTLKKLGVHYLVTIGGDGTANCAYALHLKAHPDIRIAHVPKTIDNDIPLPGLLPTFGFHTARHFGSHLVQALMEDARAGSRWYFVVTMGRQAGHLALGIGKAAGATLTVIGEEFENRPTNFKTICHVLEGAIIKRLAMGKPYGLAVIAEGLAARIDPAELRKKTRVLKDARGKLHFEEIELGRILRSAVMESFASRGIKVNIMPKNIGYELRSMPPIPFDCEYTQDLGYAAVRYLLNGGSGSIISIKRGGVSDPLAIEDLLDPKTGRIRIRQVDVHSDSYEVARKYMIRLEKKDFEDPKWVAKLAKAGGYKPTAFIKRFKPLVD